MHEYEMVDNLYPAVYYNYDTEGVNIDDLSGIPIPDVIHRGRGRPVKVANHHSTAKFHRRCQELMAI
jgi:hypothetical protein